MNKWCNLFDCLPPIMNNKEAHHTSFLFNTFKGLSDFSAYAVMVQTHACSFKMELKIKDNYGSTNRKVYEWVLGANFTTGLQNIATQRMEHMLDKEINKLNNKGYTIIKKSIKTEVRDGNIRYSIKGYYIGKKNARICPLDNETLSGVSIIQIPTKWNGK